MKKFYLLAAVATAMLAACSSSDELAVNTPDQLNAEVPVAFDVYTQRASTRAGLPGDVTTNGLKVGDFKDAGFGVFAYYTDNNTYDYQTIPNFMYNQQVLYNSSVNKYAYSPVKYWPNEYGTSAVSDDADKVSFFAYAPYVEVVPSTGKPTAVDEQTWGISLLSRNNVTGDPFVKYIVDFNPAHSIDLCWGVVPALSGLEMEQANGGALSIEEGEPWLNVQRPNYDGTGTTTRDSVKFNFQHALAKLNVTIDAVVDDASALTNALAAGTKIFVRSVTFEGFATKGSLNLNNDVAKKAKWMDYNGTNDLVSGEALTLFDGRKDGKEGTSAGEASNEKSLGLNPDLIQDNTWTACTNPGVTNTTVNLFNSNEADKSIYVIPTDDPVKITIVYDVETADGNLATYLSDAETLGSSIENRIYKESAAIFGSSGVKFENGKAYTIHLHLGMNSVKITADVAPWTVESAVDVDLPKNTN